MSSLREEAKIAASTINRNLEGSNEKELVVSLTIVDCGEWINYKYQYSQSKPPALDKSGRF